MAGSFTPEERARIADGLNRREGAEPVCPVCGARLSIQAVTPRSDVPYVRHRVLIICPSCRRSATLDRRAGR